MALLTYNSCSSREKRAVLHTFWSGHTSESEKINLAAREYGPYALGLVATITAELAVIAGYLVERSNVWSWAAGGATLLAAWSLGWSFVCQRRATSMTPPRPA